MKDIISMTIGDMQTEIDNGIMRAVQNVGINVNKEELLKALELNENLVRCKDCRCYKVYDIAINSAKYCYKHDMWSNDDDYCAWGERRHKETDHEERTDL